ncbi:unnamed protein product [Trichogramma brassicae]|uniref:TRAF-type domain-containing protein n=1 Tax=Trichogramma brassicae TaxID=86971 RepID=A0A6H5IXU2_9HYME|nr:unnamed protein product [Trichogramma brassicae]
MRSVTFLILAKIRTAPSRSNSRFCEAATTVTIFKISDRQVCRRLRRVRRHRRRRRRRCRGAGGSMAESNSEAASSSAGAVNVPVATAATNTTESSAQATAASQLGAAAPNNEPDKSEEFLEPQRKHRKLIGGQCASDQEGSSAAASFELSKSEQKLEHRLGGILCCVVCFDLPSSCLSADARLRDELATCPNCRIEISKTSASRNLAVEKAVSELPAECQYCTKEFPRNSLERHEETLCEERYDSWILTIILFLFIQHTIL